MESISLKLDKSLAQKMESYMVEFHYATKTEFIRDAIRNRLTQLQDEQKKEKAWQALFAARGTLKGKGRFKTDEEFHEWRSNEGSKEMMDYFEKKFANGQK